MQDSRAPVDIDASYEELSSQLERLLDAEFSARPVTVGQSAEGAPIEVIVRELGHGPMAVVLLHGIGSGSATWLHVALALQQALPGVRVIAWDAPGYAESTPLPMPVPKGSDYADRLGALLEALDIEEAVLVGHSLGAFTACAGAKALGSAVVKGLVLVSPAGGYGAPGQEAQRARVYEQRMSNLAEVGIEGMAAAVGQPGARMCAPDASAEARAWVRWNMARLVEGGYRQAVEMLCGDSLARYAPADMHAEVHVGDMDVVTPPTNCEAVARQFGASFALIEGPGHASPIERPEEVAAVIADAARQALSSSKKK